MAKPADVLEMFPTRSCDMFDVAVDDPCIENHSGDEDRTPEEFVIEDEISFYVRRLIVLAHLHHVIIEDSEDFYAWVRDQTIIISRSRSKRLPHHNHSLVLRVVK